MHPSALSLSFPGAVAIPASCLGSWKQCCAQRERWPGNRGVCVGGQELGPSASDSAWGLGYGLPIFPTDDNPRKQSPRLPFELLGGGSGGGYVPRWARAGGSSLGWLAPVPRTQVRPGTRDPPPQPWGLSAGQGAQGGGSLSPTLPGAPHRAGAWQEENGVGCTYLGEFGAHQEEDEEAEELPGRLHVSRPLGRPGVRGLGAAGRRLRGRGRAPGWGSGGGACSAAGAGGVRAVLRRASALHIYGPGSGAAASRAGLGRLGGGCALLSPRRCWLPRAPGTGGEARPAEHGGALGLRWVPKVCSGRGGGGGGAEGPARLAHAGRREGGGRRGSRLGQDVTSKRRGKLNWGRKLHPGRPEPRGLQNPGTQSEGRPPLGARAWGAARGPPSGEGKWQRGTESGARG
jgi:hypothetical protein